MDKDDSLGAHTYVQMTFFLGPESSLAAPLTASLSLCDTSDHHHGEEARKWRTAPSSRCCLSTKDSPRPRRRQRGIGGTLPSIPAAWQHPALSRRVHLSAISCPSIVPLHSAKSASHMPTALCATRVSRQSAVLNCGNLPSPDCRPCKNRRSPTRTGSRIVALS